MAGARRCYRPTRHTRRLCRLSTGQQSCLGCRPGAALDGPPGVRASCTAHARARARLTGHADCAKRAPVARARGARRGVRPADVSSCTSSRTLRHHPLLDGPLALQGKTPDAKSPIRSSWKISSHLQGRTPDAIHRFRQDRPCAQAGKSRSSVYTVLAANGESTLQGHCTGSLVPYYGRGSQFQKPQRLSRMRFLPRVPLQAY